MEKKKPQVVKVSVKKAVSDDMKQKFLSVIKFEEFLSPIVLTKHISLTKEKLLSQQHFCIFSLNAFKKVNFGAGS